MKNMKYCLFFLILSIYFGNINAKSKNLDYFHPLRLKFDFSNLKKNENNNHLISLLNEASNILTKLIYTDNNKKLNINPEIMDKYKTHLTFENVSELDIDIVIIPVLNNIKGDLKIDVYDKQKNKMPLIVILQIKKDIFFKSKDENTGYILLLKF